jgi:L-asparaginase / beta-aspartyl-peptidase
LTVPVLVVHGGAGNVPEPDRAGHAEGCRAAAREGWAVLQGGGCALDAVERAVQVLEDDPLFNAGVGCALTETGEVELDAGLMDGARLRVGAVCALPSFANPIRVARAVLEDGRHALYAADGAAAFARRSGFEPVPTDTLRTEAALRRLAASPAGVPWSGGDTVGAVACDARGHVAAATSTGGTMGKRLGRVGDSPVPGAGTYADDAAGAASATGPGELILRLGLTRLAVDLLRTGHGAQHAAEAALAILDQRLEGAGGIIVVRPDGDVGVAFTTATMGHAVVCAAGERSGC